MIQPVHHDIIKNLELLAQERGIRRDKLIQAVEDIMTKAVQKSFDTDREIRSRFDPSTGDIKLEFRREVVKERPQDIGQINITDAQIRQPDIDVGESLWDPLPPLRNFNRNFISSIKEELSKWALNAERENYYRDYENRVGEIIECSVKTIADDGRLTVGLGKIEAHLSKRDLLPWESFRPGDTLRALIHSVKNESDKFELSLSRTRPEFVKRLFWQEVPEIREGIIEIKEIARDPGSKTKVAVFSRDTSIDPLGACVGMRGSRIQEVIRELRQEKIDVIPWSPDQATFVVNALVPAKVTKIVLSDEPQRLKVVVPDDQLSRAIGSEGQNVRLASRLTHTFIDIIDETTDQQQRQKDHLEKFKRFQQALDLDDVMIHLLISEGFETIEDVALTHVDEFTSIEGLTSQQAQALITSAQNFLHREEKKLIDSFQQLGGDATLLTFSPLLTPALLVALAQQGVKKLEDLAELSEMELKDCFDKLPKDVNILDESQRSEMILEARARLSHSAQPTC